MKPVALLKLAGAILAIAAAQATHAAPCAGFTDVDTTSPFCPNVDWLKNRAVTLGCTSTTLYCPGDLVTRLSMAAFMNRLGTALTPALFYNEASGGAFDLDVPAATVCQTGDIASAAFPRAAHAGALLTAHLSPTAAIVALKVVQSIDNGVNWTPLTALPASVGGVDKWVNAAIWKGAVPLAAGTPYRFGLRIERGTGGGTGDLLAWNCQLKVMVTSRTGSSAPY